MNGLNVYVLEPSPTMSLCSAWAVTVQYQSYGDNVMSLDARGYYKKPC
jgi:hypothetical protein